MNFERCQWNESAEAAIAPLVDPLIADDFRKDIESGRATLWLVDGETWLVTRPEKYGDHVELVLETIAGKNSRAIVNALIGKAKRAGVKSIRFETHHPEKTAARLVGPLGFERTASTFRVAL
jgi:hypothetical protein